MGVLSVLARAAAVAGYVFRPAARAAGHGSPPVAARAQALVVHAVAARELPLGSFRDRLATGYAVPNVRDGIIQ
eukprot:8316847-Alexandrium_andersonii.AAC.1